MNGPLDSLLEILDNGARSGARSVPVLMPVALDQTYDYLVPEGIEAPPGSFVLVPFGQQTRIGIVWDGQRGNGKAVDPKKLKSLTSLIDAPPLPEISMRFAEWVARYTLAPLGMVARMMMSADAAFEPPKHRFGVRIVEGAPLPPKMTSARTRVLEVAADGLIRAKSDLANLADCSTGVIDGLAASGNLVEVAIPERVFPLPKPAHATTEFTDKQAEAVATLVSTVDAGNFSVTLLDGVTGSGKTEVYFEAVARALEAGEQALIMLPEIALTSQFLERFEQRFGAAPVEWHSALSPAERGRIWKGVARGDVRCVVGARSALFLPFVELGLIVIDEEHDQGFKQEDRVHYQARDMAVVRGNLGKFPVVLASATPSIESHVNALVGRYRHAVLPGRFSGVAMPDVSLIDLKAEKLEPGKWLAQRLVGAITETLENGQQTLLFLNRRGYAPLTLCRACGHRLECPQCTAWLVEHRFKKKLTCHHCGFSLALPEKCPKCAAPGALVACGPGVERVQEEVAERFPDARVALLSSDLIPGLSEMREIIRGIEAREFDIIIGTQIVAKGHNFPGLALVGVVDGDLGLAHGADPRAAERTFQLLHQVTGRAGRTSFVGRGFVQTYSTDHPVMQAIVAGDRDAFLNYEVKTRQSGLLPPYGRLAAIVISARDKALTEVTAREIARRAPLSDVISVLGPVEAPIAVVRGRHRWRLLVKAPRDVDLQGYLRAWAGTIPKLKSDVRVTVDIDPYNFL
ncbi:primosome assembly protein PriA [Hyphomicrobium denitrificans 1NES1]|uniref:Replication restart protein PriA n=1 Tax=Hyphomicrobium denitrificans 1NES1 TaxID=670307 RepID=N0BGL7_9HYPH|nr:primosomal protein N' [Hyphomicrobium denitrificans]AGK59556.1 primosome assembly protein PriA [Hyphomicrobium denitrificans 1NES1]